MSNRLNNNKFGGFIITYNRSPILRSTIDKVLTQNLSPDKLLILDNSENNLTLDLISELSDSRIQYLKIEGNKGPAGAAKIGLEILSSEKYNWIYWGDDDDPPIFDGEFEHLITVACNIKNIGAIGSFGSKFNFRTGRLVRYKNEDLKGILPVDTIGGNANLIVNGDAVRKTNIFPNADLFFGFEEFEFLQRLKSHGYGIYASGESLKRHRIHNNRWTVVKTRSIIPQRDVANLKREYYSYRNHIYMFYYIFNRKKLAWRLTFRALLKVPFGYLQGLKYGWRNTKYLIHAIVDAYNRNMGKKY